jgi:S-adenosylmethionine decarboxylase
MKSRKHEFGRHYLVEFTGCDPEPLARVEVLRPLFLQAARDSGATILGSHFHQFEPQGVSAMIFIAESHFSIHTWPQDGYAAFDVLTCGTMFPERAIDFLKQGLLARKAEVSVMSRGFDE